MKPFDPLRLLKETSNDLLRELFTRLGAKLNVPWDDLKHRDVAPIVLLWETMPEAERRRVHVILQEVQAMTSERGLKVLKRRRSSVSQIGLFPGFPAPYTSQKRS